MGKKFVDIIAVFFSKKQDIALANWLGSSFKYFRISSEYDWQSYRVFWRNSVEIVYETSSARIVGFSTMLLVISIGISVIVVISINSLSSYLRGRNNSAFGSFPVFSGHCIANI